MNRAVTLRPARPAEAPALAALSRDRIEAGLVWRYTPRRMTALLADPDVLAVVAADPAQGVQGFAVMSFGDEHAHLVLLCVQAAQQRCGIGRRLLDWLLASARVAGIVSVQLELRVDNVDALAFYRALGWVETAQLPGYYEGGVAARRMQMLLRDGAPAG